MRELIGALVQFPIRQALFPARERDGVGSFDGLGFKTLVNARFDRNHIFNKRGIPRLLKKRLRKRDFRANGTMAILKFRNSPNPA
jgi:hypothetical protein